MKKPVESLSLRQRLGLEMDRRLQDARVREHPLRQLFWECTLRCNLRCRHCGSDCRSCAERPDMPAADFFRVLDGVAVRTDPHRVFVILTGGEPLMRRDLEDCGREIYRRGFPWGMVTNGMALTPERFRRLMEAGMHTATVSLDGFAADHNWMRGNPLSFERAVAAIRLMASEPRLTWDVVTCVNRHSLLRLDEQKEFLLSLGVTRWRLFTIFPVGRAATDPDLQLSAGEMRRVMDFIVRTRREGRIRLSYGCEGFLGRYEGRVRNGFFSCQAGVSVGSVLADGSISACPSIRADYHQGNIYTDDFMDVWENCFQPYRDRAWMRRGECAGCRFFRYCRGNGMHLRDGEGRLMFCHLRRMQGE